MLEWKLSEWKNINRSEALLIYTHTLTQLGHMSEREGAGIRERDNCCQKIIFMFSGFTFSIGAHSISKEVVGFSPLWFPQGKYLASIASCD